MKKDILGALTLWEFPPEDFALAARVSEHP